MLLYTRLAQPKAPKRRSRAGCNYCREKKKKCDEGRPNCARCHEQGQDCVYEAVKPRQRRKTVNGDDGKALEDDADYDGAETSIPIRSSHGKYNASEHPGTATGTGASSHPDEDASNIVEPQQIDEAFGADCYDASEFFSGDAVSDMVDAPGFFADDVEEIPNANLGSNQLVPYQGATPITISPFFDLNIPAFSEFTQSTSRRGLLNHFCNVMSHLIVLREDHGNPFQQLVVPLSRQSSAVKSAIYALSSAHLEFRGVANTETSIMLHNEAIRGLSKLIEQGSDANRNELLAAIILLVYYEVLVQRERSSIVNGHLKGAMAIMRRGSQSTDPVSLFLERAFRFYDVIAALSFGTSTLSPAPASECYAPFLPVDSRGTSRPVGSADALLGMATSLWPIIHRLSNLGGLKTELNAAQAAGEMGKAAVLRTELETTAVAIERALENWQQPEPVLDENGDEKAPGLQGILDNAHAYRHSAFVHLYRSIYEAPREDDTVQHHAHHSLVYCMGTVNSSGPMGALLWPLFVAACEARTEEDRSMGREAFARIDKHQGMTNIERAWSIVQEVWRRADEAEMQATDGAPLNTHPDLWREVSRDMDLTIVFG